MTLNFLGHRRVTMRHYRYLALFVQLVLMAASYASSFALREDLDISRIPYDTLLKSLPFLVVVRMATLWVFRIHLSIWRYVGLQDVVQIVKATTLSSFILMAVLIPVFGTQTLPASVLVMDWAGNVLLLSGVRVFVRLARQRFRPTADDTGPIKRLLIVGAGDAGASLCAHALNSTVFHFRPVAFVDDDPAKVGTNILGVPVAGSSEEMRRVVSEYQVDSIVIAIPSATRSQTHRLVEFCQQTTVPFQILPDTAALLDGSVSIDRIREVNPLDLLGRPPAKLDQEVIGRFIRGRRILITGAAGSVGSELARQIATLQPELLLLVDHAENPLFFLEAELLNASPNTKLVSRIVDVTDPQGIQLIMTQHRPQVVFHAAAHKHVPFMERTPLEAIRNNVGGTYLLATQALESGVETFILVSTDKAVKPISVMGATKRLAELLMQEMNESGPTQFISVRFGNVLGSSGSVVPIFKEQISRGGPVTVTHPETTRYFMSVQEAARLILQAAATGTGGEIFLLDMGNPVRIVSLAETMITLSGLKPYEDIDIVFIGLRPGEKLSESLHSDDEEFQATEYDKLLVLKQDHSTAHVLKDVDELLRHLPDTEATDVLAQLTHLVPEYQHDVLSETQAGHSANGV